MINFYLLTKPGIIFGNLMTLIAGFLLGTKGSFEPFVFLATVVGLAFLMASGCVCNNYMDRFHDAKMERTKRRKEILDQLSPKSIVIFSTTLFSLGAATLFFFTNKEAAFLGLFGFFVYAGLYTLLKSRTVYGTAIGSVAGAIPPVVGYVAAKGSFDPIAFLLFALLIFWQMPHFFAIALMHIEDYQKANIPVLPLAKGVFRTKLHMVFYIVAFFVFSLLTFILGVTGSFFLILIAIASLVWLILALRGFWIHNDKFFGRQMFIVSLVVIGVFCISLPL